MSRIFRFTVLIVLTSQCGTKKKPTASTDVPVGSISIEYVAHACFILSDETHRIMIDPYADRVWLGYDFPKGLEVDAVFITHPHYDHDGGIFRGKRPDWMLTTPFYQSPNEYEVGDFHITGIVGKHADPYGKEFGQMNTIWIITVNGIRIAHWGDNGPLTEEVAQALDDVDILLIPMDGDYHIIPLEAYKRAFEVIEPKLIIPMHYRIPELEIEPDSPSNLGEIEPFLTHLPPVLGKDSLFYQPKIEYVGGNTLIIKKQDLPLKSEYRIFEHSPLVKAPS